ncbi:uncharacterized protein LOC117329198 isoform X2 [Pecten maximus]|nr:uncharacterized protein LOC117329198 isoform X2 [Pecten maximus]
MIFKEIEEDPRTLNKYKGNEKVQRSLGIIHDLLQDVMSSSGPRQQFLQHPSIIQMVTQMTSLQESEESQDLLRQIVHSSKNGEQDHLQQLLQQLLQHPSITQMVTQMTSLQESEESQDLLRQIVHSSKNGEQDHLQQLLQQVCSGISPPSLQIPSQCPSLNLPIPNGHPLSNPHMSLPQTSPNIPLSEGPSDSNHGHSNIKMSKQKTSMPLPTRGEYTPSCLSPKKKRENKNVTSNEDQHISVLPPKKTLHFNG